MYVSYKHSYIKLICLSIRMVWRWIISKKDFEIKNELHSILFHSIPIQSNPIQSIPFHVLHNAQNFVEKVDIKSNT